MTKENYTQMSNQDFLERILGFGIYVGKLNSYLERHHPNIFNELLKRTCFLDENYNNKSVPIPARLYCLEHNLNEQPKCQNPNCDKCVEWCKNTKQFRQYCSVKCQSSDQKLKERREQTNIKKYGHKCSFQCEEVREKFKSNYRVLHGVDNPFKLKSIQEKMKQTCQNRYGVDNYTKTIEYGIKTRETNFKKYGCEYYSQTKEFKDRISKQRGNFLRKWLLSWDDDNNYVIERYDRDNPSRGLKYHQMFDSRWEIDVFVFCRFKHHIDCQYSPEIRIPYFVDGKEYGYYPDFLINGRLYEVKGDQFFKLNESTNELEMFIPWRKKNLTNEQYDFLCRKENAKYHCMLENNVEILGNDDIKNLSVKTFS